MNTERRKKKIFVCYGLEALWQTTTTTLGWGTSTFMSYGHEAFTVVTLLQPTKKKDVPINKNNLFIFKSCSLFCESYTYRPSKVYPQNVLSKYILLIIINMSSKNMNLSDYEMLWICHFCEFAIFRNKFFVRSRLDDIAIFEHKNHIGILDGREPVSDDDTRTTLHQSVE